MSVVPAASQMRVPLGTLVATTLIAATPRPERRSIRHPACRFRSAASHPRQASVARYSRRLPACQEPVATHAPRSYRHWQKRRLGDGMGARRWFRIQFSGTIERLPLIKAIWVDALLARD